MGKEICCSRPQRIIFWCKGPPDACTPSAPQAAGYGVVEFAKCVLEDKGDTLKGKRCLITGSGKVSGVVSEVLQLLQHLTLCRFPCVVKITSR